MAETKALAWSHAELIELLIKHAGIHRGHWGLTVKFGLGAGNAQAVEDSDHSLKVIVPTAFVGVMEIGIREFDNPGSGLSLDASKVNPPPAIKELFKPKNKGLAGKTAKPK